MKKKKIECKFPQNPLSLKRWVYISTSTQTLSEYRTHWHFILLFCINTLDGTSQYEIPIRLTLADERQDAIKISSAVVVTDCFVIQREVSQLFPQVQKHHQNIVFHQNRCTLVTCKIINPKQKKTYFDRILRTIKLC